ncbi:D-alanyl-D-alanine carboxypeptidase [Halalkalibacterium halodurans]|uniref:D-alanyl-D-alanine carboxypeptidase family protein n=1 Tax=Halalkalibacterium halodurans TaxID=86665 RepID=UPI002E24A22B|nr:D-alanyl-D-alanine carboxypeptidase [Halalkalibacterium halodurans]MED4087092.1 D-alanyl-D-alanine carboxypeptidase [Halalkalibacterium halodurans]MED4106697.1 D-alanyl-D-alanine carboxypeptidase [Halalkalibacterium halodurans]MED4109795.1 D-alanyl-D-alanine carboxypeptidase [Halalkalibacterium halodurans]MED4125216.1 D-alanyl-D-alanine carboxypeptidase [Halalkalibacterium halodurans]
MRVILSSIVSVCLVVGMIAPVGLAAEKQPNLAKEASSAIVIERDTGQVLFEKNSDEKLPPASMTKIMTLLLIMEAIDSGKITYDDMVRTSENAASMGGSQVFLEPGEEMSVRDMIKAIAIASGNDASVAMAEHLAGTEEEFVGMMNEKARQLGLKNTNFVNTNGLPEKDHYTSAYDLAMISKELLKYEDITEFTSVYEDYLRKGTDKEFWLVNTNRLVKFYPGVDGLKTGYTKEAKYCLTATAVKNGMRVITVVMGAPTPKERNSQITEMLDFAFSQYQTHQVYERDTYMMDLNVRKGNKKSVPIFTSESVSLVTKKGESIDNVTERVEWKESLLAPVHKGDVVGTLYLERDGEILSETPLIAGDDVASASFWQMFKRIVGKFGGTS